MMKTHIRSKGLLAASLLMLALACSKTNEEELKASSIPCNTDSVSYSKDIVPLFQNYCAGCHGNGNTAGSGGINLDSYLNLKVYADNGKLVGNVTHAPGFIPMPYGQPKMPDCQVNTIVAWVSQGTKNN